MRLNKERKKINFVEIKIENWFRVTSRVARSYYRKLKGSRVLVEAQPRVATACLLTLYHIKVAQSFSILRANNET